MELVAFARMSGVDVRVILPTTVTYIAGVDEDSEVAAAGDRQVLHIAYALNGFPIISVNLAPFLERANADF